MPVSKEVKDAVKRDLLRKQPLMDLPVLKKVLLEWLMQWNRPDNPNSNNWNDLVQEFPADPGDNELTSGTRMRLVVRLATSENRYLIAILESLDPNSRGVYFISVFVNWKEDEYRFQHVVESSYAGHFDGTLKAKHTLWAQTFRQRELLDALNSCAVAILGHELIVPPIDETPDMVKRRPGEIPSFPEPLDD